MLHALMLRLRAALLRGRADREMDAELADHLERETRDLMARDTPRKRPGRSRPRPWDR